MFRVCSYYFWCFTGMLTACPGLDSPSETWYRSSRCVAEGIGAVAVLLKGNAHRKDSITIWAVASKSSPAQQFHTPSCTAPPIQTVMALHTCTHLHTPSCTAPPIQTVMALHACTHLHTSVHTYATPHKHPHLHPPYAARRSQSRRTVPHPDGRGVPHHECGRAAHVTAPPCTDQQGGMRRVSGHNERI